MPSYFNQARNQLFDFKENLALLQLAVLAVSHKPQSDISI